MCSGIQCTVHTHFRSIAEVKNEVRTSVMYAEQLQLRWRKLTQAHLQSEQMRSVHS